MIILYLPYSKSLGQFFLFSLHWDLGGALCLSHWCDLLLGFGIAQPGWEDRMGKRPGGNPKDLKDSKVLWFQWIFFDVFFLFIFFHHLEPLVTHGKTLVSFFSMKLLVEKLKLAGKWRSLRCNKVVMQWVFDELEWNVWSPGVWKIRSNGEKTPSLQRESGVVKKIHVGLYASPNVLDTQNTASSIGGRNSF